MKLYIPTIGEEKANSISHGVIALLLLLFIPFAAVWSFLHNGAIGSLCVSIYLIAIFGMTLCSTLYHSMAPSSRHKEIMHILDHIFIYVAIAGTYTPIALCVIGGWQGTAITIAQWAMVIFGILYKSLSRKSIPAISLTIYLTMGWTIVIFAPIFIAKASPTLLTLIGIGGVCYSIGAWFYARKGFKYHHLVWHLFINIALILHLLAIVFYL